MHLDFRLPAHVCRVRLQASVWAPPLSPALLATLTGVEAFHA